MSKEFRANLVIVGGGAAGMTAAVVARQKGVRSVIVLEKRDELGGNGIFAPIPARHPDRSTWFFKGHDDKYISENDLRVSNDPDKRADGIFQAIMDWTHWRANAPVVRVLSNKTEIELSEWWNSLNPETGRNSIVPKTLERVSNELGGIEYKLSTPAKKILKDEKGKVCGVLSEDCDGEVIIHSKSVIIATGGFLSDTELMSKYFPNYDDYVFDDLHFEGKPMNGDGIKMAFEAGAVSDGTVGFEWILNGIPFIKNYSTTDFMKYMNVCGIANNDYHPEVLWVNKKGMRFADESKLNGRNSIYRQPHKAFYIIFDRDTLENSGGISDSFGRSFFNAEKFEAEIRDLISINQAAIAMTWSEAAKFIGEGCMPEILEETVFRYNASCDIGIDDLFCKPQDYLRAIRKPPYYIIQSGLPMLLTHGPLKVDEKMRLVDKNDDPIIGLYAAGVDIGGVDVDTCVSSVVCHCSRFAIASGMIAAENVASELK